MKKYFLIGIEKGLVESMLNLADYYINNGLYDEAIKYHLMESWMHPVQM